MRRYRNILLTALALLLGLPGMIQAQVYRDEILFVSERDGNREIYAMRSDGTSVRRLTNNPSQDISPAWSPDRTQVAFVSNRADNFDIYVMSSTGQNVRQLTRDHGTNDSPTWSPDGTQIAFVSNRSGVSEIYIVSVNGGTPRQITRSSLGSFELLTPAWSPDARQIAFVSNQNSSSYTLRLIDLSGNETYQYRLSEDQDAVSPAWSKSGRLAFGVNAYGYADIVVLDANKPNYPDNTITSIQDARLLSLSWSPDEQEIIYVTQRRRKLSVNIINVNGQSLRSLLDDESISFVSWNSPSLITAAGTDTGRASGSGSVAAPPPVNQRAFAPPNAVRLNGGRGLGNGARQDGGNFQVEGYCSDLWRTNDDWYCGSRLLTALDFDNICQRTYLNPNAFAIRDGGSRIVAYNWRCYAYTTPSVARPSEPVLGERLCSNSPPPRLRIGDAGYVTYGHGPSNLNRYPRRSRNNNIVVDIIPEGGTFTVIDGPVCGDGLTWWRVRRTKNSFLGWLAEGQGNIYWLARR